MSPFYCPKCGKDDKLVFDRQSSFNRMATHRIYCKRCSLSSPWEGSYSNAFLGWKYVEDNHADEDCEK